MKKNKDLYQVNDYRESLIEKIIENIGIKYSPFIKYFDNEFFKEIRTKLMSIENINQESNLALHLSMQLDNLILKHLCDLARKENIDLVILLIERYTSTLNFIKRNAKFEVNENLNDDDILIQAIETYYGLDSFKLHLCSCLKKLSTNNKEEDFYNKLKKNSAIYDNKNITVVELIIRILDIYEIVPQNEELLKKFIYLKYGYYENKYFNLDEISDILNLSQSDTLNLYKNSLLIAKNISSTYLNSTHRINKIKLKSDS